MPRTLSTFTPLRVELGFRADWVTREQVDFTATLPEPDQWVRCNCAACAKGLTSDPEPKTLQSVDAVPDHASGQDAASGNPLPASWFANEVSAFSADVGSFGLETIQHSYDGLFGAF